MSIKNIWRSIAGVAIAALGLLFGAASLAPAAPAGLTVALTPLGTIANGDSLRYQLTWQFADDGRGAADGYAVSVVDSAGRAIAPERTVGETVAIVTVPAPAWGGSGRYTARVYALRRGLRSSAPATVTWTVARDDVAPPAPGGLQAAPLDPVPVATDLDVYMVGTTDTTACRPMVASVLTRQTADTAWFVRALPGMSGEDVRVYCVATGLVVELDGWVAGMPEREPTVIAAGEPLPIEGMPVRVAPPLRLNGA